MIVYLSVYDFNVVEYTSETDGNMVIGFKLTQRKYDPDVSNLLCKQEGVARRTGGHSQKWYKQRKHGLEVRKHNVT